MRRAGPSILFFPLMVAFGDSHAHARSHHKTRSTVAANTANPGSNLSLGLYHEGEELFRQGQYRNAADTFEKVYVLAGSPVILFDLAQAQ